MSIFYSILITLHLFFACNCYAIEGDNKGFELVLGEIISVEHNDSTGKTKIILKDIHLTLAHDAQIFNKKKELCSIYALPSSGRYIFTWVDINNNGAVDPGEMIPFDKAHKKNLRPISICRSCLILIIFLLKT